MRTTTATAYRAASKCGTKGDARDADGDGIPNHLDVDSDDDGIPDHEENADLDENGMPDYLEPSAATLGGGACSVGTAGSRTNASGSAALIFATALFGLVRVRRRMRA